MTHPVHANLQSLQKELLRGDAAVIALSSLPHEKAAICPEPVDAVE